MDNEKDCGHVIRAGNSGRHRDNDNVRDNLHQNSENAGGDHMADTASLKEILFRHSAEQCKVCEAIPFEAVGHRFEYEKFKMLHEVIEEADLEDEEGGEDMEDKQKILDLLLPALQATRNLSDLVELEYREDRELVYAKFASGNQKIANVAMDSGTALIRDVIEQIV